MEFGNDIGIDESQLDRDIRAILDSQQHEEPNKDIERLVSILWEKVTNCHDKPGDKEVTTLKTTRASSDLPIATNRNPTDSSNPTNSSNSTNDGCSIGSNNFIAESFFQQNESISTNTRQFSSTQPTPQPTSPSTLSDLAKQFPRQQQQSTINNINNYCCKNDAVAKKLTDITYLEFINQKQEFCQILKQISLKTENNQMYFYIMDSSINVKTNSLIIQLQSLKGIQYVVCEGYKSTLIFCDYLLNIENFMYFTLLSQVQVISLHTVANLSMNHLATNRLPMYMSLNNSNESKFVRTFLKFTRYELHYNSIKNRIPAIIKHSDNCKLQKK